MSTDLSQKITNNTREVVGVVMVSYHCGEDIVNVVRSLLNERFDSFELEFFLVDNASTDNSLDQLRTIEGPRVQVIASLENVGFGRGCNLAFEQAKHCDKVLLLNPDIELLDSSIESLVTFSQRVPEAKFWGGQTLNAARQPDGKTAWREPRFWHVLAWAFLIDRLWMAAGQSTVGGYRTSTDPELSVDAISGSFLLIDNALLQKLNGFDPQFFMYSEEIDLARRAREQGARPVISSEARLVHTECGTVTSLNRLRFLYGSKLKYYRKHWSPKAARSAAYITRVGFGVRSVLASLLRQPENHWKALLSDDELWGRHV